MSRGRIVRSGTTTTPTMSDPLSFLEPFVENCLEVTEEPTRAPPPTAPPTTTILDLVNATDSGEVAPSPPPGVVEASYVEVSSVMVEPMIRPVVAPVVYAEPPLIIEPEPPMFEPVAPLEKERELDLTDERGEKEMRRKRSSISTCLSFDCVLAVVTSFWMRLLFVDVVRVFFLMDLLFVGAVRVLDGGNLC